MPEVTRCADCEAILTNDNRASIRNDLCNDCGRNYAQCSSCDAVMRSSDSEWTEGNRGQCRDCVSPDTLDSFSASASLLGNPDTQGDIIKSPRVFGVELETVYRDTDDAIAAAEELKEKSPRWGMHQDGSIEYDDNAGGIEIVSPRLCGKEGEDSVKDTCALLRAHGFRVNDSCGFHVHFTANEYRPNTREDITTPVLDHLPDVRTSALPRPTSDYTRRNYGKAARNLKTLFIAYISLENLFLSLVHKKRRGNRYCNRLTNDYRIEQVLVLDDYYAIERLWYASASPAETENKKRSGKSDDSRYHTANFHSLFRYGAGTFEVRLHGGTLNTKKILHWVNLHANILDAVADGRLTLERMLELGHQISLKTLAGLADILNADSIAYLTARINRLSGNK